MDQIRLREARPDCPTGVTVLGGSMFFKDTDRVLKTMRRRGTASAFGDGFARRYNPIHGADLAARCRCFACSHEIRSTHGFLSADGTQAGRQSSLLFIVRFAEISVYSVAHPSDRKPST